MRGEVAPESSVWRGILWYMVQRLATACLLGIVAVCGFGVVNLQTADARNITEFSDTVSDSKPGEQANHTLEFTLLTDVGVGGYFDITPPPGFSLPATSTFGIRNVELLVDGAARSATASPSGTTDGVTITSGSPGQIRYTLDSSTPVPAGSEIELRIGNHTSGAKGVTFQYSSSTGTTTVPADIEPIRNATSTGDHDVQLTVHDGGEQIAEANFLVFITDPVGVGPVDTREEIPPFRFNGAPTSTVGGTTLNVEISLETNEFANCKYSTSASTTFAAMTETFENTGLIFHNTVVPVTPGTLAQYFVRCVDDEGNFNTTDFLIQFSVNDEPTGQSTSDGGDSGSGTGTGSEGTGDGGGGGGQTGAADGELDTTGGDSGGGGSGGGGGGGSGGSSGSSGGGGFESTDGPYRSGDGRVVISGFAFPDSEVTILVDGEQAGTVDADADGGYEVTLDEIARGAYTFGVYAIGPDDVRSSTFSTSFSVTGARTSALSNINVPPSVSATPDPVDPGEPLTLSGYTLPDATVTIENGPNEGSVDELSATSDGDGAWSVEVATDGFSIGTYRARASADQGDEIGSANTNFSDYAYYGVGEEAQVPLNSDLNRDGFVNLTDFSILLFWWNSDGGDSDPPADINQDGTVNLTDFSILLFNWTG